MITGLSASHVGTLPDLELMKEHEVEAKHLAPENQSPRSLKPTKIEILRKGTVDLVRLRCECHAIVIYYP